MGDDTQRKHDQQPSRAERRRAARAAAKAARARETAERFFEKRVPELRDPVVMEHYVRYGRDKWHLHYNAELILFALVERAADPHLTEAPAITVEEWAHHFNIRPTQVTYAFRKLRKIGIPKPPAPIPLDGLLRFLADKLKACERALGVRAAKGVPGDGMTHVGWIEEYFKSQRRGDA